MSLTDIVGSMIILLCIAVGYGGYLIGCWQTREKCWREEQVRIAHMEPSHAVVTTEMLRKAKVDMFTKFIEMTGAEVIKSPARQKGERGAKRREERDWHSSTRDER